MTYIRKVAATCFFHLGRLRQIRCRVGQELTLHLVLAYVITLLDYCNSLLAGFNCHFHRWNHYSVCRMPRLG